MRVETVPATVPTPAAAATRPAAREITAVGLLWAALLAVMFVTYARIDPSELYHVSNRGVAGGLSRVLVELDFPVAFVGIAVALLTADRLPGRLAALAVPVGLLCAVVAVPGVVDQSDLDARAVNVVPALGVLGAAMLHLGTIRRSGSAWAPPRLGDRVRVVIAVVVVAAALPYLAAEAGWYLPDVLFVTGPRAGHTAVVHHGHHHGLDGALLVLSVLLLSRPLVDGGRMRAVIAGFLGLLSAYGAVLFVQDSWNEQIAGRGATTHTIGSPVLPALNLQWAVIVVLAVTVTALLLAEAAHDRGSGDERSGRAPTASRTPGTIVALGVWAITGTLAVGRTLAMTETVPFTNSNPSEQNRTARLTIAVVVAITSMVWIAAVTAWHRSRRLDATGAGRHVGLFMMLAAVLLAVTPFGSSPPMACPGPLLAKTHEIRHPEWEYICGYDSTPLLAAAVAALAVGAVVLLRAVRRHPAGGSTGNTTGPGDVPTRSPL